VKKAITVRVNTAQTVESPGTSSQKHNLEQDQSTINSGKGNNYEGVKKQVQGIFNAFDFNIWLTCKLEGSCSSLRLQNYREKGTAKWITGKEICLYPWEQK